ncbi:MAG: adenosylcobinamide-GDP ribazoletransferase [Bilifractor sp.]|jgi:adenosylcobinamide-GDP ribazoletransferase
MSLLKSFVIALSLYSRIPVPQFSWEEKDMRYVLCFFPAAGAAIAALLWLWHMVCLRFGIGDTPRALIMAAIPLAVSGGIHVDGFMDTADALHSYRSREKKLEILKDSHIGAFAVIRLMLLGLIYTACMACLKSEAAWKTVSVGYIFSRALSGFSVVVFPKAKKEGMAADLSKSADQKRSAAVLAAEAAASGALMMRLSPLYGAVLAAVSLFWLVIYRKKAEREFGGITGDTSGYFLVISECCSAVAAAVLDTALF